jgi:hypothetical protein
VFRWLPLVRANLMRRKLRFTFTFISILLAFLMFGMLDALRTSLSQAVNLAGADRLMSMSKVNITVSLPRSYFEKVKAVQGVRAVVGFNWFGGLYKDSKQQLQVLATDPEQIVAVYPELKVKPDEFEKWKHDRQGVIVGPTLANNFGWKVGDRIPIRSDIWRKGDGGDTWEFNIDGIYDASGSGVDKATIYFHYDYFNESLQYGKDQVGWMVVRVVDPARADELARRIDSMFANSPFETTTATERAFIKRTLEQVGNIGHGGVLHHAAGDREHDGAIGERAHQRDRRPEDARFQRPLDPLAGAARIPVPDLHRRTGGPRPRLAVRGRGGRFHQGLLPGVPARYGHAGRRHLADGGVRRDHRSVAGVDRDAAQDRRRAAAHLKERA